MGLVVKWLAEVSRNWAVLGSFSATSKLFSGEPVIFKRVFGVRTLRKKEWSERPYSPISATLLDQA